MMSFNYTLMHSPSHHWLTIGCGVATLLVITTAVAAETNQYSQYKIPDTSPEEFKDIWMAIDPDGTGDADINIYDNMDEAMCGGWDFEVNLKGIYWDDSTQGLIPRVAGLPGRNAIPWTQQAPESLNTVLKSGMSKRQEEYVYPESAIGFATVCRPEGFWDIDDASQQEVPDVLCEHPCQRPLGDVRASNGCELSTSEVELSCGGGEMRGPDDTDPTFEEEMLENGKSGGLCHMLNFYVYPRWSLNDIECTNDKDPDEKKYLNRYTRGGCEMHDDGNFPSDSVMRERVPGWNFDGWFGCCSDAPLFAERNCIICEGAECQNGNKVYAVSYGNDRWRDNDPNEYTCDGKGYPQHKDVSYARQYKSFYRQYPETIYKRATLQAENDDDEPAVPDDAQGAVRLDIPVSCYGFYESFRPDRNTPEDAAPVYYEDALTRSVPDMEKWCVIAAYYPDNPDAESEEEGRRNFWEMNKTQEGTGKYQTEEELKDDPFDDPVRNPNFNEEKDFWYSDLGGGFSMINDPVFQKDSNGDITFALLAPDVARHRATPQLQKTEDEDGITWMDLSSGALVRATDDTVDHMVSDEHPEGDRRSIVEWWQKLSTEIHKRLLPPIARVRIPSHWSLELDPLDPIYIENSPDPDAEIDPRMDTMEVQIHAEEDLLGDVVGFLERQMLLRITEEPIPLVVPMGSPTEFRADAHAWEIWAREIEELGRDNGVNTDAQRDEAQRVAEDLRTYADYIDDVRELRAELPRYAGTLLTEQRKITQALAEWLRRNAAEYRGFMAMKRYFAGDVAKEWEDVQAAWRKLSEKGAFPWSRNDRYTTPIYSLLDPWMPDRPNLDPPYSNGCPVNEGELPMFHDDFSSNIEMDISGMQELLQEVRFPVLKPVQVRIVTEQLQPPAFPPPRDEADNIILPNVNGDAFPTLPDLPDIPSIYEKFDRGNAKGTNTFPEICTPSEEGEEPTEEGCQDDRLRIPMYITFPTLESPNQVECVLNETKKIIGASESTEDFSPASMGEEYKLFWNSIIAPLCTEDGEADPFCIEEGEEQDCLTPHEKGCVHFEMDLRERFQRIGARPAVLVKDDFLNVGTFRNPIEAGAEQCEWDIQNKPAESLQNCDMLQDGYLDCPEKDWTCLLQHATERLPREGWQFIFEDEGKQAANMDELRTQMREETWNASSSSQAFPYVTPSEKLIPSYEVFPEIPLVATGGSLQSSSSSP